MPCHGTFTSRNQYVLYGNRYQACAPWKHSTSPYKIVCIHRSLMAALIVMKMLLSCFSGNTSVGTGQLNHYLQRQMPRLNAFEPRSFVAGIDDFLTCVVSRTMKLHIMLRFDCMSIFDVLLHFVVRHAIMN